MWNLLCRFNQDHRVDESLSDHALPLIDSSSTVSSKASLFSHSYSSPSYESDGAEPRPAVPGSQEKGAYRYKATSRAVFYLDGEEIFSLKLYLGQPEVQFSLVAKPSVVFATTQDRGISFVASDCPDKVCIHTGVLKAPNSMAACLPNHLVLVIESIDSD